MARYNFSARAAEDLRGIVNYTKKTWGARQAAQYRQEIELALQRLAISPGIGRQREEVAPGLRSFAIASHIAFYVSRQNGITIARLLHSSMDVVLAFEQQEGKER